MKDEIKLAEIAKKLALAMPRLDSHRELAFGTLLDYYLDTENVLLAVRAYKKLPTHKNIRNPYKFYMREFKLSVLIDKVQAEKKKPEAI